jgi:Ras-related protein Rab-11A
MSTEQNEYTMLFKIVIIGDTYVGKTNILSRYISNEFDPNSNSTIGVELTTKTYNFDNNDVKVQIWDTAGQEKYRSITSSYYKGAQGCLLVYDITKKKSFDNIDKWYSELKSNSDEKIYTMLLGNKSDLEENREVSIEEAEKKAKNFNIAFMETSAYNGNNINKAFNELINNVYQNNKHAFNQEIKVILKDKGVEIPQENNEENKKDSNWCCI